MAKLVKDITEQGLDQGDLVKFLANVRALANELRTNYATNKTLLDELKLDLTRLIADVTAIRSAVVGMTAKLDADEGVTDTNYAATLNPAALTVTAIAASPAAALTTGALTLSKG